MKISQRARIILLLVIDVIFFLIEISTGSWIRSLALIADSFHMLNDIISLIVALYATKLTAKTTHSPQYSYGLQRAEILGALVNGVFLMALCFSIFIDAIERFFDVPEIQRPEIIIGVGGLGLLSNIIGLLLFHEHGHGHHGHHDHGHDKKNGNAEPVEIITSAVSPGTDIDDLYEKESEIESEPKSHEKSPKRKNRRNLNIHGVFLHVLGDALGNIGVIITGLFIRYTDFTWKFYVDPAISLVLTVIIFSSAWPLVKKTSNILLQRVPSEIPIDVVRSKIKELPDVLDVHELHIWQLSDTKRICTIHVLLSSSADYMKSAISVRGILHAYGVHSLTIQPEFVRLGINCNETGGIMVAENPDGKLELVANETGNSECACLLRCNLDDSCAQYLCCPPPSSRLTEKVV